MFHVSLALLFRTEAAFPRLPPGDGRSMLQLLSAREALGKLFIQLQRMRGTVRKGCWAGLWGGLRGKEPRFCEVVTVSCHSHRALPS